MVTSVAVLGATGFVGTAVVKALSEAGHRVIPLSAPRLHEVGIDTARTQLEGDLTVDAVINAAGVPEATALNSDIMEAAHVHLPSLIAEVCASNGTRFVHISSASVQGRRAVLDSSPVTEEFSAYSSSKASGERAVRSANQTAVIYRPPGVHDSSRRVTAQVARISRSRLASVAGRGDRPAPQAQLRNVASAAAFLATCEEQPPPYIHHPWEGITAGLMLLSLSGREPRHVPMPLARFMIRLAFALGRLRPDLSAYARRLEVMWMGQAQARSWLEDTDWVPPVGLDGWRTMGSLLSADASN